MALSLLEILYAQSPIIGGGKASGLNLASVLFYAILGMVAGANSY